MTKFFCGIRTCLGYMLVLGFMSADLALSGMHMSKREELNRALSHQLLHKNHDQIESQIASLLQQGADVNSVDSNGDTLLMRAASLNKRKIVKMFLEHEANVNYVNPHNGDTALIKASSCGSLPIIKLLLDYNASVNYKNPTGQAALSFVLRCPSNNTAELVALLLSHGAFSTPGDKESLKEFMTQLKLPPLSLAVLFDAPDSVKQAISNQANSQTEEEEIRDSYSLLVQRMGMYLSSYIWPSAKIESPLNAKDQYHANHYGTEIQAQRFQDAIAVLETANVQ